MLKLIYSDAIRNKKHDEFLILSHVNKTKRKMQFYTYGVKSNCYLWKLQNFKSENILLVK